MTGFKPGLAPGFCDRCGDRLPARTDGDEVVQISYRGLSDGIWHELDLCPDCQEDMRVDFYARGLAGAKTNLD